ncbi:WYL domain-containing protein [Candidatus Dojkabacteria bacterium]|nr:WYL domain-containing protein [Candidatus Dojkabacteria bacterium]
MPDLKPLERQIRILQQFTLRSEITVDWLYEYFERVITKRTLQRDLIALTAASVPLNEKRSAHGEIFWSLNPNYLKFIPMTLGMDEFISSLLLKRMAGIFKNTPIENDIKTLDNKIKQLITDDVLATGNDLQELEPYFNTLNFGYIDYGNYGEQLQKYLFATINRRPIQVTYRSSYADKPKCYVVYPYSLLLHRGTFYGIVYHPKHNKYINLLIHRIEKIDIIEEAFERNPEYDLESYLTEAVGVWHEQPKKVQIKFHSDVATRIKERIWQKGQKIIQNEDGSIILELNVAVSYELVAWILRWGSFAEVISPSKLVEMVRSEVENLKNIYLKK